MSRIDINAPKDLRPMVRGFRAAARRAACGSSRCNTHFLFTDGSEDPAELARRRREALDAWGRGERVSVVTVGDAPAPAGFGDMPQVRWSLRADDSRLAPVFAKPAPQRPGAAPLWAGLFAGAASKKRKDPLKPDADYVFVSYARADADAVQPFIDAALAARRRVWVDRTDLTAGALWPGEIVEAVRRARMLALFGSARAFASDHVFREVSLAAKFKRPILPVFLDGAPAPDAFLYYLSIHQAIRSGDQTAPARFVQALGGPRKRSRLEDLGLLFGGARATSSSA